MSDQILPCFNKHVRDFLVSVTIHKARNLSVLNADTLAIVNFGEETKKTKIFQNSDCPFFNEVRVNVLLLNLFLVKLFLFQYFVFELRMSLEELLRKNIRLSVVQTSCFLKKNSIVGEVSVNLGTVWKQNCKLLS